MARHKYTGTSRDGFGTIIASASVAVYLAGTTTAATIYAASTGSADSDSVVSSGTDGVFTFYIDESDYGAAQEFKIVISKSGYTSATTDNIRIFGPRYSTGTLTLGAGGTTTDVADTTVTASCRIFLTPTSANAAADQGSATGVWVTTKTAATSFTLTHPNNANADKTFDYIIFY